MPACRMRSIRLGLGHCRHADITIDGRMQGNAWTGPGPRPHVLPQWCVCKETNPGVCRGQTTGFC